MKALERDPEVRYQDAGEMHRDLERVLHEWQPATASGLSRFLELLFDEPRARRPVSADWPARRGRRGARSRDLDLRARRRRPPPAAPEAPAPAKDPMSIQKLLKRFGIK